MIRKQLLSASVIAVVATLASFALQFVGLRYQIGWLAYGFFFIQLPIFAVLTVLTSGSNQHGLGLLIDVVSPWLTYTILAFVVIHLLYRLRQRRATSERTAAPR